MKIHQLPKTTKRSKKRLGRGYGSGKGGHTSGRGQKGQKARSKVKLLFEGTKIRKSFLQQMPVFRGKGRLKPLKEKPLIVKVGDLEHLKADTQVTVEKLVGVGMVDNVHANRWGVKIVNGGKLTKKLTVFVPVSKKAQHVIEKAGGKVERSLIKEKNRKIRTEKPKLVKEKA